MTITQCEEWLQRAGYEHQCFISYPRIRDPIMSDCANRVKEAIENDLSQLISNPNVFLDTSMIGGTDWEKRLKNALCHSISMVALCAPIYYHPDHNWCGLEWAAMDTLCEKRIPGEDIRTIIPLIVRVSAPLPDPVSRVQSIDISRLLLTRHYYHTNNFRSYIRQVVSLIERVAIAVARNEVVADCRQFEIPQTSAFAGWLPTVPPPPFRRSGQ